MLIVLLGTNFSENLIRIGTFALKKNALENVVCEMRPFYLELNVFKSTENG